MLALPSRWAFVWYKSGRVMNVANTDTLTADEAKKYKEMWDFKRDDSEVCRVTLETNKGDILKTYDF